MKKNLLLLSLFLGFALMSCKKESAKQTFCFECNVVVTMEYAEMEDLNTSVESTETYCDLTENEARKAEASGSSTATMDVGGLTAKMKSTTKCKKQ